MPELTQLVAALEKHRCINLTTYRKNSQPVVTTVWFVSIRDRLYIWTENNSGKIKRIRNNSRVELAPATHSGRILGPCFTAQARLLPPEEWGPPEAAFNRRYGSRKRFFEFIWKVKKAEPLYVEIVPIWTAAS